MKKLILALTLSLLLALAVGIIVSFPSWAEPAAPLRTLHSSHHFLPPYPNPRDRFGFDSSGSDPLTNYDVALLHAGWYSNWGAGLNPAHPDGLTYVQLIRTHAGSDPHDPEQVIISPSKAVIAQIAAAHPGSLWLMGNEPDSLYQGEPIYPEVYAHVYYDLYTYIKGLDPTALIANGGIVQPTPCRMEYLDIVWDTYQQAYSETMPVDVWNIHAFVLREVYGSWGASTPPGVNPSCGIDYRIRDGDDINIFRDNLVAFRQWMKDKGEQDKPLIISEYGILWPDWFQDEDGKGFPPARVSHFMTRTFDLFLTETYTDVGYPEDDYRLVQTWAWYSLSDDHQYNGYLFHSSTKEISPMGETYANYTAALADTQYTDLAVQLWADLEPLEHISPTVPYETLTITLPVTGTVANLGKLPANVLISAPLLGYQDTLSMPARYEQDVGTLPLPSLVLTRSGLYDLALIADPTQTITEPRRWNNAITITVEARADLVISMTAWSIQPPGTLSDVLDITFTVANEGVWPAPPVSGTLYLSNTHGTLLLPGQRFSIPAIGLGAQVTVVEQLTLPASSEDFYRLALEADSDEVLDEQDESNNHAVTMIPIVVTTTLQPDAASALTSTSGHLAFLFPAGTVTTPTEICFTPIWPPDLPPGPPLGVAAFDLAAYQDGQPISLTPTLPITVTWQYTDADVAGLDEDRLYLYHVTEGNRRQRVSCPAEQRQPEENRLRTCIQQLGEYIFGQVYEHYLPAIMSSGEGSSSGARSDAQSDVQSDAQWSTPGTPPGLPLRLPPWAIPPASR